MVVFRGDFVCCVLMTNVYDQKWMMMMMVEKNKLSMIIIYFDFSPAFRVPETRSLEEERVMRMRKNKIRKGLVTTKTKIRKGE